MSGVVRFIAFFALMIATLGVVVISANGWPVPLFVAGILAILVILITASEMQDQ